MLPMFSSYSAKMLGAPSRSAAGRGSSIETPSAASRSRPCTFAGMFVVYSVSPSVRPRRDIPSGLSRGRGVGWGKVARTSVPRWTASSRPRATGDLSSPGQTLASARASPASASSSRSVTKRGCRRRNPSAKKTYADTTSSAGSVISGRTRAKKAFGMTVPAAELEKPVKSGICHSERHGDRSRLVASSRRNLGLGARWVRGSRGGDSQRIRADNRI